MPFLLQILLFSIRIEDNLQTFNSYSPTQPEDSNMDRYEKKGYLDGQFRLFHLTDQETREIEYHYHDFDKITIFVKGRVTYVVEGRSYELKPYDIVLVKHNDLHRLTVDDQAPYERIIVYISPSFIEAYKTADYDLSFCFQKAYQEGSNVLRIPSLEKSSLFHAITRLERSFSDEGYACGLYRQLLFLEFLVHLNRAARRNRLEFLDKEKNGSKVSAILQYINDNLSEDLSIGQIAETFYISKYHMMRLFKQETGYTMGSYISQKRLLLAKELILSGMPPAQACFQCGYRDYSTFFRAYRKLFGRSPQDGRTLS